MGKKDTGTGTVLEILVLLASMMVLAYWRAPVMVWTLVLVLILSLITFFSNLSVITLIIFWILFLAAAIFANASPLRRHFFTSPLFDTLKKRLPAISQTEREAIEAGNVWWEKDLFCGRPQWKTFLLLPQPKLSTEEQAFLNNQVETLCNMLDDWKIVNEQHDLSVDVWNYLKQERFLGMVIPKEYGGRGFSALAHSTIVLKIASRSISTAVNAMVPNSLGPGELILHYGTAEQKEYYLPRLARGEEIPCFGLTSPEAGSDAGSIIDTGIVCKGRYQDKEVLGIRLSWDKRYITLAPVATVIGLAFKLYDPENLLGKGAEIGITLCLVPRSHPGVQIGHRHLPMNLAFMNGPTRGQDVFIPMDWIIGGVAMAGCGWKMLMECLSIGRSISLPALATAAAKLTYRRTGGYARLRRQFNTAISNFEGVEEALGQIAGLTYTMEAARILTAGAVDLKITPAIASAIAKYHLTEMGRTIVSHSMDIHGGHAIQMGPRNDLAYAYFAIPVSITVEGANILTRSLIIFGQGAIRCHPYIYQEIQLLAQPKSEASIKQLDQLLLSHIGYLISNILRSFWFGLTAGKLQFAPVRGVSARYYRQLTRMSSALALLSDVTMMILGGSLKRRERTSARLGDILSQLYLASAVLKYFQDHKQPDTDINYVQWSVETALHAIQLACDDLLNNYSPSWMGKLLHWLIFPLGRSYRKPKDNLTNKIVSQMLSPSEFRDRISEFCFVSKKENDSGCRIEKAFASVANAEILLKKLKTAIRSGAVPAFFNFQDQLNIATKTGILTEDESQVLNTFENLYQEIIKVDEFSFDLKTVVTPT